MWFDGCSHFFKFKLLSFLKIEKVYLYAFKIHVDFLVKDQDYMQPFKLESSQKLA
jgi:hypothetical protein